MKALKAILTAAALAATTIACISSGDMADKDQAAMNEKTKPPVVARYWIWVPQEVVTTCSMKADRVYFDYDSAEIGPGADAFLTEVAACLKTDGMSDKKVVLVGHTDSRGTQTGNKVLAAERALNVAAFLKKQGVPANRIDALTAGERAADGEDKLGFALDRKVEIRIKDMDESTASN